MSNIKTELKKQLKKEYEQARLKLALITGSTG